MYKMILVERELLIKYQIVYYDNAIATIVDFNLFALFYIFVHIFMASFLYCSPVWLSLSKLLLAHIKI